MKYLILLLLCGCSTTPMTHGIPNFRVMENGVYRGGQPTKEGWSYLRSLGVYNDIKLNLESKEEEYKEGPIFIYEVPVTLCQQIGLTPMPYNFGLSYKSDIGGTYIHCEHGQDRTGLFVAMWRMRVDGWTKQQAEDEMLKNGFHKSLRGLWSYWKNIK